MIEANKKKFERAQKALEIAQRFAEKTDKLHKTHAIGNRINAIKLHPGYAYESDDEESLVATGNWNEVSEYNSEMSEHVTISDLPVRLSLILEKLGFEVEWDDQWAECSDCYKIVRTDPDSFGFVPQYIEHAGGVICKKCLEENAEGILVDYTFKPTSEYFSVPFEFDVSKHGYTKYKEVHWTASIPPERTLRPLPEVQEVFDELKRMRLSHFAQVVHDRGWTIIFWVEADEYEMYKEEQKASSEDDTEGRLAVN